MPLNIIKMIFIRILRLLIRLLASLASAVVLVSGYLFFLSLSSKGRDGEGFEEESDEEAEEDNDLSDQN